jgi:glutamate-1-semialdehyde 2,1-aminomutase
MNFWGLSALSGFNFDSSKSLEYKTFITQEMLKNGFLASNCVYACVEHSSDIIDNYFEIIEPLFETIKECEDGRDIRALLDTKVCHSTFKRLN